MRKICLLVLGLGMALYLIGSPLHVANSQGRGQAQAPGRVNQGQGVSRPEVKVRPEAKVAPRAERNAKLEQKLAGILPAGTDINEASQGFKNQGQFVAAAHVSKNLQIPFTELKTRMTGDNAMSLGQAIHELRPDLDSDRIDVEVRKVEKESRLD